MFVSGVDLREYIERLLNERDRRFDDRFVALDKALTLQATEYARRLYDLNGEYQRDRERQNAYVTVDKWEDRLKAEAMARSAALQRVDEKFEEYVKRYEVRQREIDLLLAAQKGAADAAIKAAEEQGRKSNRNIAISGFILGVIVFLVNIIPTIVK